MKNFEEITKLRIPDEDMPGWLQVLREGGFDDKEIDSILVYLNKTYRGLMGEQVIKEEIKEVEKYLQRKYKKYLNDEQREYLKKGIELKFEELDDY